MMVVVFYKLVLDFKVALFFLKKKKKFVLGWVGVEIRPRKCQEEVVGWVRLLNPSHTVFRNFNQPDKCHNLTIKGISSASTFYKILLHTLLVFICTYNTLSSLFPLLPFFSSFPNGLHFFEIVASCEAYFFFFLFF